MSSTISFAAMVCAGALAMMACSSGASSSGGGDGGSGNSGGDSGSSGSSGSNNGGTAGGTNSGGNGGSTGGSSQQGGAAGTSPQGGAAGTPDPFEQNRVACVDKINALRATRGLPPYARWKEAEPCVDQQATEDETNGKPHGAWSSGKYSCNGGGQNECLGAGPNGIEGCLESMWAEREQAGCAGCDQCNDAYNPNCPNCDFYGQQSGDVCGHYVNMNAKYFSKVACGFSSLGGWDAINFE